MHLKKEQLCCNPELPTYKKSSYAAIRNFPTIHNLSHISGIKMHSFADLTIRHHYQGKHQITRLVNGQNQADKILDSIEG
jgi:hypothetical protein